MEKEKSLDFEVNLMPMISILAVCICFLLLTGVWVHVGTLNLSQAVGTEVPLGASENPTALWVRFENDSSVQVSVKNGKDLNENIKVITIQHLDRHVNARDIERFAKNIKVAMPQLNVALILPAANSSYEDIVAVMDRLKKQYITNIGIAPL